MTRFILQLRFTSSGTLSWASVVGGSSSDRPESVMRDSTGKYRVVGHTQSYGAGNYDAFLLKFNDDGSLNWAKTVGDTAADKAYDIIEIQSGDFIVVGETKSYGAVGYDVLLIKYDSYGNLSWAKRYGDSGDDTGFAVVEEYENYLYVAGVTDSVGAGDDDAMLLRFTSSGFLSWTKVFGGSDRDRVDSITRTANGSYVMSGLTESFGTGWYDGWLVKFASNGSFS